MTALRQRRFRPILFAGLALTIPAFYLGLAGPSINYRAAGSVLYALVAILIAVDASIQPKRRHYTAVWRESTLNILILVGAVASAWPTVLPWGPFEWLLRLGFCSLVFVRLSMLLVTWMAPRRLLQTLALAVGLLAIAGAGFYWLEPRVLTYADGLWLAFVTGATVGYGDLVPTAPASRLLAVFIVLFGYAVFSIVTASIAALFVGEEERRYDVELQVEMWQLREEIADLRAELHQQFERAGMQRKDS